MGEVGIDNRQSIIKEVFEQYVADSSGDLTPEQLQVLHADLRIGGISIPQVKAAINYVCATENCDMSELFDLLQEMDRRYFLLQNLRWEFSFLDREKCDYISEEQAKWLAQCVHREFYSNRNWEYFLLRRLVPGSGVTFPEIEVMLCNIPNRLDLEEEWQEEEKLKQDKLEKQRKLEEAARLHAEKLARLRDEERKKKELEKEREEQERRRKQKEEEEKEKQEEEERRRKAEEEEQRRLKEIEEENERKRKEEEEKYKDADKWKKMAEKEEKEAEEELKRLKNKKKEQNDEKKRKELDEAEKKAKILHKESKNKRIKYQLKVAIKSRDKFQLEYSVTEFKKSGMNDDEMDLAKAERLLKELTAGDNLHKAMSKRELEELEKAMTFVKHHGFENQLASEMSEANKVLVRLKRLERIRHEILELKQSTVAEIRSYQNPPAIVHTVMTATFLALGHKEKETKDWKAVQALVGKTGKESVKRKCLELKASTIPLPAAKRVKTLLDKYELDAVRDVSAGAATFYVWATTVVEEAVELNESK
ncbi:hypothetical protein LOTGIDRAFT_227829 [Lottia gigantea]|uniref:EF-hand domain-containing protein n=1 Tax=Lottia gigantea TaxID=225164 RepID=V4BC02_LOTGI|nr:hypothetical protein LOTGIDRAFT_227829 [Lottia gigantea]ESP05146.1 hypothetical protein LOTGIDRAFT_227829 [Lottia gigantea]